MAAPSYEQLAALVAAQERTIASLQTRIAEQDAEIAELKWRLAASSRNWSKPPSSDGLDKPASTSLRGRAGRKPGGQPGREGRTLRQVAVPDEVVVHEPGACAGCGAELAAEDWPAGDPAAGVRHSADLRAGGRAPAGVSPLPRLWHAHPGR